MTKNKSTEFFPRKIGNFWKSELFGWNGKFLLPNSTTPRF